MPAGLPNGFRSSVLKTIVSTGWKYKSLQSPGANPREFRFSGYNAVATKPGETIKITPNAPLEYDSIELEALAQPEGGAIDVQVNGGATRRHDLRASVIKPVVIKVDALNSPETLHELLITTEGRGVVSLASISISNSRTGLTYNSVGYSGATINILNKLDSAEFAAALYRINPDIVVLSFGTNESASTTFDLTDYKRKYERVVQVITAALPNAAGVIIAPPDFNRISSACPKPKRIEATCGEAPRGKTTATGSGTAAGPTSDKASRCVWQTPPLLAQVRDVQQTIAEHHGFKYWNWGSIMSAECGAHEWYMATPRLMTPDHVHFTADGYRKSASEFLPVLQSIIESVVAGRNAFSNH